MFKAKALLVSCVRSRSKSGLKRKQKLVHQSSPRSQRRPGQLQRLLEMQGLQAALVVCDSTTVSPLCRLTTERTECSGNALWCVEKQFQAPDRQTIRVHTYHPAPV